MDLRDKYGMFSSNEVASLAGLSLRQIQWLDERGPIQPVIEGHKRIYTQEQVIQVVVLAALRRHGISLRAIRNTWRVLARGLSSRHADLVSGHEVFLLFNSEAIEFFSADNASLVVNRMLRSGSAWSLISMRQELKLKKKAA